MTGAEPPSPPDPAPGSGTKVARAVRAILADLSASAWTAGIVVDREAAMRARYGIGRDTLREAIRILEADGLLRMKPGREGGLVRAATPGEAARHLIETTLRLGGVPLLDVWDAEAVLLAEAADLAARNIAAADIPGLRQHVHGQLSAFPSPATALRSRLRLRTIIARIGGNHLLRILLPAATNLGLAPVSPEWLGLAANAGDIGTSLAFEQRLVEAIVSGDVSLARQHVAGLVAFDRAHIAAAVARGDLAATIRADAAGPPAGGESAVYAVMRRLTADIAAAPPAAALGTEEALVRRLGAGRSIVRQALRVMEQRGMIALRRGKGGGIFRAEPSGENAATMAATYCRGAGVGAADAGPIAQALDLATAPAAAQRGAASGEIAAPPAELTRRHLSDWVAVRSGNAVLALFARICADLRADGATPVPAGIADALARALAAGDAGVARRIIVDLYRPGP